MRRIIFIVILLGLIAFSGWFYFSASDKSTEETNLGPLQVKKVLDESVIAPIKDLENDSIWYFTADSRLFEAGSNGIGLSEWAMPTMPEGKLLSILWPKVGNDFIAIKDTGKFYYASKAKIYIKLSDNIKWLEWLPDGKRVVYVWLSNDKKSQQLVMANADGTGYKTIAQLFWSDLVLKSSDDGKTVLMYRTPGEGGINKLYSTNLETGAITTVVESGYTTGVSWLSNNKFIYEQKGKLFLYNVVNQQSTDLNLNSSVTKIVSDDAAKFLYVALAIPDGGDRIVKFNLDNGISETYYDLDKNVHVKSLLIIGSTLYYTDSKDGKLYSISR